MATDPVIDPTTATVETTPPPTVTPDSEKTTEEQTVEEKLAAAEAEAKMWKGRAEKANTKAKSSAAAVSEEDMNWAIDNNPRVALVKDAYEKELKELEDLGAKITNAAKTKALDAAERITGIAKSTNETSGTNLPPPSIDRSGKKQIRMTESDQQMKIKPETIEKYRDVVEGA